MEPLIYIMAIMGCADDGSMCRRERIAPATYRSESQCLSAMPNTLRASADMDYPMIQARCERTNQRAAQREIEGQRRS